MGVKVSTGLPSCREGRQNLIGSVTPKGMLRVAKLADELGFYSLWPNEFMVTRPNVTARYAEPPNIYDLIVTMSSVMAVTEKIRITPSTLVLPYYEPIMLSRQLATLDQFSGGRVALGIGLGGEIEEYRRLRGTIDKPNRGQMMDEYLEAMQLLWTERQATYHGRYVHFTDVETHPKPVQQPLPIFMAGHAEGVFRRLAKYGHGWIDSTEQPESIQENAAKLHRYAAEAGRGDIDFEIARQFYISIAPSEEEAKANHAATLPPPTQAQDGSIKTKARPSHWEQSLIGSTSQIRDRLLDYVASGVSEICVIFYYPDVESAEAQMRLFAEEVMPALT